MIDTDLLSQARAAVQVAQGAIQTGIATAKASGTADQDQQLVLLACPRSQRSRHGRVGT